MPAWDKSAPLPRQKLVNLKELEQFSFFLLDILQLHYDIKQHMAQVTVEVVRVPVP